MNWNDYQQAAARTLIDAPQHTITPQQWAMVTAVHNLYDVANTVARLSTVAQGDEATVRWNITGLLGEVGELVDVVKKDVFHQHPTSPDVYKKEVGDILWYWAACCTKEGAAANSMATYPDDHSYRPPSYGRAISHTNYLFSLIELFAHLRSFVEEFMPFTLEEAAAHNIAKLLARYPNGFDPGDSVKRVDVE